MFSALWHQELCAIKVAVPLRSRTEAGVDSIWVPTYVSRLCFPKDSDIEVDKAHSKGS